MCNIDQPTAIRDGEALDSARDERFKHMITGVKINEQSARKMIERSDL